MAKSETTDRCLHDGLPCYASEGTPDAHWRCGTVQCGKQSMQDCYRHLMAYVGEVKPDYD